MSVQHASSESYARSGFANRMGWGKRPALLIIDVCKAYWDASSPLSLLGNPDAEQAPDSMRRLVKAARAAKIPVVWSQVEYTQPDMADAGLFWHKAKVLDVWKNGDTRGLAACLEGLEPADGDAVVVKKYASAFFGTTLASTLQVTLSKNIHKTCDGLLTTLLLGHERRYPGHLRCEHIRLREGDHVGRDAAWLQTDGM